MLAGTAPRIAVAFSEEHHHRHEQGSGHVASIASVTHGSAAMQRLLRLLLSGASVSPTPSRLTLDYAGTPVQLSLRACEPASSRAHATLAAPPHGSIVRSDSELVLLHGDGSDDAPRDGAAFRQQWLQRVKADVAALAGPAQRLVELASLALEAPARSSGWLRPARCVLLSGPSGTAKSALAHAVARHSRRGYLCCNAAELFGATACDSAAELRRVFGTAGAVLVLDNIDAVTSCAAWSAYGHTTSRASSASVEAHVAATLLELLDRLNAPPLGPATGAAAHQHQHQQQQQPQFVIGVTNRPEAVHAAFLASGRFDVVVATAAPTAGERLEVLQRVSRAMPLGDAAARHRLLQCVSDRTHGFVGADLVKLCNEAALRSLRRQPQPLEHDVALEDFEAALAFVRPSALGQYTSLPRADHEHDSSSSGSSAFEAFGGIDDTIRQLQLAVVVPLQQPQLYARLGVQPPNGILIHGPSGTGKTCLARALALESRINVITVNATELVSKLLGESERNVARLFAAARASAPCMLLIDQIEALAAARGSGNSTERTSDRILSCFLTEMDGVAHEAHHEHSLLHRRVIVVGTTVERALLDAAILRPGRFDEHVATFLPRRLQRYDYDGTLMRQVLQTLIGLDWIGFDSIGLDWIGLDWIGLDWIRAERRSCARSCAL